MIYGRSAGSEPEGTAADSCAFAMCRDPLQIVPEVSCCRALCVPTVEPLASKFYRDARHVAKQRQTDADAAIALLDIDVRDP
jgi:hypothetical protein